MDISDDSVHLLIFIFTTYYFSFDTLRFLGLQGFLLSSLKPI